MYHHSEVVKVINGKYKGQIGIIVEINYRHKPTLYEVLMLDGKTIALYENEIEFP